MSIYFSLTLQKIAVKNQSFLWPLTLCPTDREEFLGQQLELS